MIRTLAATALAVVLAVATGWLAVSLIVWETLWPLRLLALALGGVS